MQGRGAATVCHVHGSARSQVGTHTLEVAQRSSQVRQHPAAVVDSAHRGTVLHPCGRHQRVTAADGPAQRGVRGHVTRVRRRPRVEQRGHGGDGTVTAVCKAVSPSAGDDARRPRRHGPEARVTRGRIGQPRGRGDRCGHGRPGCGLTATPRPSALLRPSLAALTLPSHSWHA